jgi:hypothetical protein
MPSSVTTEVVFAFSLGRAALPDACLLQRLRERGAMARKAYQRNCVALALALSALPLTDATAAAEDPVVLPKLGVVADVPLRKVGEFHLAVPRFAPAAVGYGNAIYVVGGQTTDGSLSDTVEQFDVPTGKARQVFKLKHGRLFHRAVAVGDELFVIGGSRQVARVDPPVLLEPGRGGPVLPDPTDNVPTTNLVPVTEIEVINLRTGTTERGVEMPDARTEFACVALGHEIHVIGGTHRRGRRSSVTNTVLVFDTQTRKWREGTPMRVPRQSAAVVVDGTFVVVAGGYTGLRTVATMEVFNPRTSQWSDLPPLCREVSAHSAVFCGRHVFMFGDYTEPETIIAYDLKEKSSEWFTLQFTATRHTAAVVSHGRIYVIGGKVHKTSGPLDLIQVFEPTGSAAQTVARK